MIVSRLADRALGLITVKFNFVLKVLFCSKYCLVPYDFMEKGNDKNAALLKSVPMSQSLAKTILSSSYF